MGDPEQVGESLAATADLDQERAIALLDRATEVGLLSTYGRGYYAIHPALPWFLADLFTKFYGAPDSQSAQQATHAYATAIAQLCSMYAAQYDQLGRREMIGALRAEEANLIHARQLAIDHGWWNIVMGAMAGLAILYDHTGRRAEWMRLVEELTPGLVDPATDGPRLGREEDWSLFMGYLVRLAERERDYATAERLQRKAVEWRRTQVESLLTIPSAVLDDSQRVRLRNYRVNVQSLAQLLRDQNQSECVELYIEALELAKHMKDRQGEAIVAYNLARSYQQLTEMRDLAAAERWYQHSLDLHSETDYLGRARCIYQLGHVEYERFDDARKSDRPNAEALTHLNAAAEKYHQALDLLPADSANDLAVVHHQLGSIYSDGGNVDMGVRHFQESIQYEEMQGNRYGAAQTRFNVALILAQTKRLEDALLWAQAALRDFQAYGDRATRDIAETQRLVAAIEESMAGGGT